jgi:hypothetical protein
MGFLKNILGIKEKPVKSYSEFWTWFQKNEKEFFDVVKSQKEVRRKFFDKLSPKLAELKDGFFYLTGMLDDNTAELVITADSHVKNIVFVEELVDAAPGIDGWKFTSLKPAMNIEDVSISMAGYSFNRKNLNFYSSELADYPDEIDITLVHDDFTEESKQKIINGSYIFLDNYLGELDFAKNIDHLKITGKQQATKELVPISKLKDFLVWRQKEFIEKYEGVRYDTENDEHSVIEAELESGNNLIAVINTDLLRWDSKASHPWIAVLTLKYDGSANNGMPSDEDYSLLDKIQDELMSELKDSDGYLNIGRQTANGEREIYFACADFRKPSKCFFQVQQTYSDRFEMDYDIYKDKYWKSFERFTSQGQ